MLFSCVAKLYDDLSVARCRMMTKLNKLAPYSSQYDDDHVLTVGEHCCVKFRDDMWYRASIEGISAQSVQVSGLLSTGQWATPYSFAASTKYASRSTYYSESLILKGSEGSGGMGNKWPWRLRDLWNDLRDLLIKDTIKCC